MREAIENAFPQVVNGGCLLNESRAVFHVYDSEANPQRCVISYNDSERIHFTVKNPEEKDVHFLAIDKCVFNDQGPSRCDFAIFSASIFCFVEIKDVKVRGRQKARKHAKEQLLNTIEEFTQRGVSFSKQDIYAIICFVKKEMYPSISAQYIDTVVEFEDRFGAKFLITNNFTI